MSLAPAFEYSSQSRVNTAKPKAAVNATKAKAKHKAVKGKIGNAVKASACWGNPQEHLQDKEVINSGCSRHMIGNMSFLIDYEEINKGYVAFGGNPKGRKITSKGGLTCLFGKAMEDETKLWNRRLGHLNLKKINKIVKGNLVRGLPSKIFKNDQSCVACQKEKQYRASCKTKVENFISTPLYLLYMDLFRPTFVKSLNTKMYCLVVTDDYSRFTWVFFLGTKDETSGSLKSFITWVENLMNLKVKVIRCDNGTEFKSRVMNQFCKVKGIMRQYSIARTPQQNEVAERRNKTLIEASRTLSISFLRPFGCLVTILNTIDHLGKFDGKADEGFFIGYSLNSKAFRVFNSRTKIVEENLHARFSENTPNNVGSGPNWLFDIDALTKIMNNQPVVAQSNDFLEADFYNLDSTFQVSHIPTTRIHKDYPLEQVIEDLHSPPQTRRMTNNLEEHGKRAIGSKWVFRNKMDERGIVIKNKVRLVAQGHTQEEGINYDEVFSPVARIETIRLFLAYASFKDFIVYQMDVMSAFLYGKIEKEVYVCQPPGFKDPDFPDKVYKVEKALYDLHQALRAWPDIMFVVCACARYQVTPKVSHLHDVKRIFRYLKGQPKLEKPLESDGFEQIVDFLNANQIKYALTVNPTIYTSCIKQFWTTVKIKTVNDDVWLQALIDEKKVVINEASIRHDLKFNDAEVLILLHGMNSVALWHLQSYA
uniref:Integrase catalytic domain-containing protein n=1 Tax=Tanacetum cinerariifolium TaxID=118510 RepID=A0A6L2LCG8_TANCI|nr:hypothetical protein [Tanacetum cinerariifolium]